MTDKERLLEQIQMCELEAKNSGADARGWMTVEPQVLKYYTDDQILEWAYKDGRSAGHYALTALALRELLAWGADLPVWKYELLPSP